MSSKAFGRTTALSALIMAAVFSALQVAAKPGEPYKIGDKIADFVFKSDQGKKIRLSDYKGKIVVLNFFATW